MDFVHDQLATGKKIRVLTVVDTFSRFSPIIDPRFSYRAEDVVRSLERICRSNGYPKTIRVDQGTEFISRDMDLWAYAKGVIAGVCLIELDALRRPHCGAPKPTPSSRAGSNSCSTGQRQVNPSPTLATRN